jgi:hypothetical protein
MIALVIVVPTSLRVTSSSDSIHNLLNIVNNNTLQIPAPSPKVADWPIVGKKVHAYWSLAHSDLPAFLGPGYCLWSFWCWVSPRFLRFWAPCL